MEADKDTDGRTEGLNDEDASPSPFIDRDDDSFGGFTDSDYSADFPGTPDNTDLDPDPGYAAFASELDDPLADWPSPETPLEELPEVKARTLGPSLTEPKPPADASFESGPAVADSDRVTAALVDNDSYAEYEVPELEDTSSGEAFEDIEASIPTSVAGDAGGFPALPADEIEETSIELSVAGAPIDDELVVSDDSILLDEKQLLDSADDVDLHVPPAPALTDGDALKLDPLDPVSVLEDNDLPNLDAGPAIGEFEKESYSTRASFASPAMDELVPPPPSAPTATASMETSEAPVRQFEEEFVDDFLNDLDVPEGSAEANES
ncbi:MAG: hypothetical protein AAF991_05595, partial [Pseudomonadota bacterium]